ncbi:RNA polymerase sigma-70 factor (ECF subfamily) [Anseongella ginsenosidimutans]|uniref:RNA polymerase sigma factor n=1 Tax=Anseongella ginsenosidimutans TaxID=496056 RepID=A0A4R3KW40_9SPHI|nr:sigma-70 family RNA polymerase sigma factor [Anseongella ginsenosidimutans]QEC51813.1 sigma-70 family RNA polymerase sigma factor [Anseongella ginsenosidimutans]TCS89184.1 RNA polymerase sigma-70 factor (ECF subfamily) [Anseongella ginsenosidimutans]
MTGSNTDIELIEKALSGERRAYEALVKRHQQYVFTLAMRFTRSREDAEEIAQDSFLKAFRNLSGFQGQSKFTTWLYTIVYTTAMTHLRKKRHSFLSLDDEERPVNTAGFQSGDTASLIEKKIERQYIEKAIERLLPDDATILTLFYLGEQSLDEIARTMGMPAGTVKVKLHRSRQRFRSRLEVILKEEARELL